MATKLERLIETALKTGEPLHLIYGVYKRTEPYGIIRTCQTAADWTKYKEDMGIPDAVIVGGRVLGGTCYA